MQVTLYQAMVKWPCHIDYFERQYDKAFLGHHLFGEDIIDKIHMRVQVFLHSCNKMSLENVETGELTYFGELKIRVNRDE